VLVAHGAFVFGPGKAGGQPPARPGDRQSGLPGERDLGKLDVFHPRRRSGDDHDARWAATAIRSSAIWNRCCTMSVSATEHRRGAARLGVVIADGAVDADGTARERARIRDRRGAPAASNSDRSVRHGMPF